MRARELAKRIVPKRMLDIYQAHGMLAQKGRRVWAGQAGGEPELRLLPALCDPSRTSIDIGGNEGGYAWHMRRLSSALHVFEPIPELAQRLSRGFAPYRRVHVHNIALSDRPGTLVLRIPVEDGQLDTGRATIEMANTLLGGQERRFEVEVRTLDSFGIASVGFVKIDVEGHELEVLHGAAQLLAESRPAFLIEVQETHRPGAFASVTALFEAACYQGLFLLDGALHDLSEFRLEVHQRPDALDEALVPRPGQVFVNNFLFLPDAAAFRARVAALPRA
jgi:FkbM family methyltransferase